MKQLFNYFRNRREQRLRKWCASVIPKVEEMNNHFVDNADWLYRWITTGKSGDWN